MNLAESGEMYLESILILSQKLPKVRSIDICEYMNYSKPSISRAVGILKDGGMITVDDESGIKLTDAGREIAEKILERHNIITDVLVELGVDQDTATFDACRIEHVISEKSFAAIKHHVKDIKKHP